MAKPNFVFIMTDTQGANVVGCYTGRDYGTNNLDTLAAEGIRFDRAYTTCPLCTPARGGIFTGLMPSVNGANTNNLAPGWNIRHMGQYFRQNGYLTAYTGKWHLDGLDYFDSGICPDGWEDTWWYDGRRYLDDLSDSEISEWRNGARDKQAEFTWGHRCSDRAVRFLEQVGDEPFVLAVSYDEPHGPFVCPPEYYDRFANFDHPIGPGADDDLTDKPLQQQEWAGKKRNATGNGMRRNPRYFGCNAFIDDEIGRVIEAVNQHHKDNTWIIYTSDHGDMFGAHQLSSKGACMYDEIARIPFIVRGPGVQAGSVVRTPVSHLDILPTMLELAGAEIPPLLHGRSLAKAITGDQELNPKLVPIEFTRFSINHDGFGGHQPIRAVVSGRYKLVINLLHTDELYDLESDPAEIVNLIDDPGHAEIRDQLHDGLLSELDRVRDPFRGYCWERRPWRKDQKIGWDGPYRHRPDDGFTPTTLAYKTGRPPTSWVEPG